MKLVRFMCSSAVFTLWTETGLEYRQSGKMEIESFVKRLKKK